MYKSENNTQYSGWVKGAFLLASALLHEYFIILLCVATFIGELLPLMFALGYYHGFKSINEKLLNLKNLQNTENKNTNCLPGLTKKEPIKVEAFVIER